MQPTEEEFILGLIAGEGSFFIAISKHSGYSTGWAVRAEMQVHLGDQDNGILDVVQEKIDIGHVGDSRETWAVSNRSDCEDLIDLIEGRENSMFRETEKYEAFKLWKEAIEMMDNGKHLTEEGIVELARLREDMTNYSVGRSAEEIAEELGV